MSTPAPGLIAVTGATGTLGGRVAQPGWPSAACRPAAGRAGPVPCAGGSTGPRSPSRPTTTPDAMRAAFAGADTVLPRQCRRAPGAGAPAPRRRRRRGGGRRTPGRLHLVPRRRARTRPSPSARHHWLTEERLRERGLAFTFLRDSIYLDFLPFMAGERGRHRGPGGRRRFAPVARADVVRRRRRRAARRLRAHDGQTYDVTGCRPCRRWPSGPPSWRRSPAGQVALRGRDRGGGLGLAGASTARRDWEVEGWITSYLAVATGELAVATDVVERLAGHPPRELAELVSPGPPDSPASP